MARLRTPLTRSLTPAALCALVLAACGGSHPAASTPARTTGAKASGASTKTLYIYSSLPQNGPEAAESRQVEQGIEFALDRADHRMGIYSIVYRALSDSRLQSRPSRRSHGKTPVATSHGWNATATVQNAVRASRNPETVAYIGDLDSGATELSLPIINQAGIVQLTPGSGYPGLTDYVPDVTPKTEPDIYYPQGRPSLLRLIPNDVVQTAAAANWLKNQTSPPCHALAAVAFGGDIESTALVNAVGRSAKLDGLAFVPTRPPGTDQKTYAAYVNADLVAHQVDCVVVAGRVTRAAVAFTTAVHLALPGALILGTSGLCNPRWSDPARGGVPAKVDTVLYCMTPVLPLDRYPGGGRFAGLYQRAHHRAPTAYMYYGYMAGSLVLQAIREIGTPDSRQAVMSNLVDNGASVDVPTTYTFDSDGDPTGQASNEYGLDRVDSRGIPRRYKVVAAP